MAGSSRITYLDGWRGSAVLAVLFSHFVTMNYVNFGRFGVELFFVLSGRLMAEILFVRGSEIVDFLKRRFTRIYPALIIFLIAAVFIATRIGQAPISAAQFLAAATLTSNYANLWTGRSEVIDHIWSLCVEEHCYLLLATIALIHRKWHIAVVPVLVIIAAIMMVNGAAETFAGLGYAEVYWRSDVRGASVFVGAAVYLINLRLGRKIPAWVAPVCAVIGVAAFANVMPDPIKHTIGTIALAVALTGLEGTYSAVRQTLSTGVLVTVGTLSYSLYLWQQVFYKAADTLKGHLVLLPLVFVVGWVSFKFVEQPSRKWLNARLHDGRSKLRPRRAIKSQLL